MSGMVSSPLRRAILGARYQKQAIRCMASGGQPEKSWSEIAGEAMDLAKTAADKVFTGVSDAASRLIPGNEQQSSQVSGRQELHEGPQGFWSMFQQDPAKVQEEARQARQKEALVRMLGGGVMGHTLGRMLHGFSGFVEDQMREAEETTDKIKQRALPAIQKDPEVREALGKGVKFVQIDSQNMSSSIVNGQRQKETSVGFTLEGLHGRLAQAEVTTTEGGGEDQLDITVRLPDGRVVSIDERELPRIKRSRQHIRVEWKEVK